MQDNSKTIAMSATLQAAFQVQSIARKNIYDDVALQCLIGSLFKFQSDNTMSIFRFESEDNNANPLYGLQTGLHKLALFSNAKGLSNEDREVWRYVWLMLQLSKKLLNDNARIRRLGQLLHSFSSQNLVYEQSDEYFRSLAEIYQTIVSSMQPKIMVYGDHGYLQLPGNAEKVRCVLLSGIRASYLWWQLGGKRWKFALPSERANYIQQAKSLIY